MSERITNDDVRRAMLRAMRVRNELARARTELARMLQTAKEQGLFVSGQCSGSYAQPCIVSGTEVDESVIRVGSDV